MSIFSQDDLLFNRNAPQRGGAANLPPPRGPLAASTGSARNLPPPVGALPPPGGGDFIAGGAGDEVLFGGGDNLGAPTPAAGEEEEGGGLLAGLNIIGATLSDIAAHLNGTPGAAQNVDRTLAKQQADLKRRTAERLARDKFEQQSVTARFQTIVNIKNLCDVTSDDAKRGKCYDQMVKQAGGVFEGLRENLDAIANEPDGVSPEMLAKFLHMNKYPDQAAAAMGLTSIGKATVADISGLLKSTAYDRLVNIAHTSNLQDAGTLLQSLVESEQGKAAIKALGQNETLTVADFSRMAQQKGKAGTALFDPSTIDTLTTTKDGLALLADFGIMPRPDPSKEAKESSLRVLQREQADLRTALAAATDSKAIKTLERQIAENEAQIAGKPNQPATFIELQQSRNEKEKRLAGLEATDDPKKNTEITVLKRDIAELTNKITAVGATAEDVDRAERARLAETGKTAGKEEGPLNSQIVLLTGVRTGITIGEARAERINVDVTPKQIDDATRGMNASVVLVKEINRVSALVEAGGAEARGAVAWGANFINNVKKQIGAFQEISRSIAVRKGDTPGTFDASTNVDDYSDILQEVAGANKRTQAALFGLAYSSAMAVAAQSGRGLSDQDVNFFIRQIGAGGDISDPEITLQLLDDMRGRVENVFSTSITGTFGKTPLKSLQDRVDEEIIARSRGNLPSKADMGLLSTRALKKLLEQGLQTEAQ